MEEPYMGRLYTVTINDIPDALPFYGVQNADIFFEMLVNDYATRGLAMFSNPAEAGYIGSIRSARYNFVDICEAYDAILAYAGGSDSVISKIYNCGIDHLMHSDNYFYRDYDRMNQGWGWEHCLFIEGSELVRMAEDWEYRTSVEEERDYGLIFTPGAVPDGEDAQMIHFRYWDNTRAMEYNPEKGVYEFWMYGDSVYDGVTYETVTFKNVVLMYMDVYNEWPYHVADLDGSGEGYYACNGKIIPIQWHHEDEYAPFTFTLMDGTPLEMDVGNNYFGFIPWEDEITWE